MLGFPAGGRGGELPFEVSALSETTLPNVGTPFPRCTTKSSSSLPSSEVVPRPVKGLSSISLVEDLGVVVSMGSDDVLGCLPE